MILSQGGAAAARRAHTPKVAGSNPALATLTTLADRGLAVCLSLRLSPALYWPGIFLFFVHAVQCIFLPQIKLSDSFRQIRRAS